MMEKFWMGQAPKNCDICGDKVTNTFVDGKTKFGPWGFMCPHCHNDAGYGVGTARGQKYTRQADGRWLKTGG